MSLVNVLMSTYNGEKFLGQLMESVLNQKNADIIFSIRDDGSTDRTIDLLKSYQDERISLSIGRENLKPARSFLKLLRDSAEADYYAYCDQDDVWDENKLNFAVKRLEGYENEPALFMHTYDVVDENLNLLYRRDMEFEKPMRMETTILFRTPSACTMVFNKKLRDIINLSDPENIRMHDYWTLLIADGIKAKIVTEDVSLMKYRIHGENSVGLERNYFLKVKKLLQSAVCRRNERMLQAKSLYDNYSGLFDEETNQTLLEVIHYKDSLKNKIAFLKDKKFRWDGYINLMFYISVIAGVF